MSVAAVAVPQRRAINPWFVAAAVVVPTFMEVLDTTIANVALRYIAGGLSAAVTDSEWVITSYLAANAVVLPISGWLGTRLGRRNYFLLSVGVFTLASGLCGMATSLPELIAFRVLQGLAGGGLQPTSQAVLLDEFPPERQGTAMTVFGMAALVAPILGPTLGGYITDNYSWRWIFYINIPTGLVALAASWAFLTDPEYLVEARDRMRREGAPFDTVGLALLGTTMVCWEVLLSKGQEWDWFGDPFFRVQTLAAGFVLGLGFLIRRETRIHAPLLDFRPLRDRNFVVACVVVFCAYGVLYGSSTSLPGLLQSLFGYDALQTGLVMSPAGFFAVALMPVVAYLMGRGADARWLVAGGLLVMSISNYWMAHMNLDVDPAHIVWPRVVQTVGLSMIFAPLSVAAYKYIPQHLRGAAVGLFSLLRNEGGSVGTSLAQTVQERREQFHTLRLGENLDPLNPNLMQAHGMLSDLYRGLTGDAASASQMAWQSLSDLRAQQAQALAYFDSFWLFAVLAVCLIPPVLLLMRRSVAEKGEHVAAE